MLLDMIESSLLQTWIAAHFPANLKNSPADSWVSFLAANGGVGGTIHDLESSWLSVAPQNAPGSEVMDQWALFTAAVAPVDGVVEDRVRTYFSS